MATAAADVGASASATGEKQTEATDAGQPALPTYYVPEEFYRFKKKGDKDGNFVYNCCKCKKDISTNSKSRLNLRNHIKRKHEFQLAVFDDHCKLKDKRLKTHIEDDDNDIQVVTSCTKQLTVPMLFNRPKRLTQGDLDAAIVSYISKSVLPFYHVENKAFIEYTNKLHPGLKIKSHKTYQSYANAEVKKLKESWTLSFQVSSTINYIRVDV